MNKFSKTIKLFCTCLLLVTISFATGCKTWVYTAKHRGIYTILYNPTNIPIENIDLNLPCFAAKNSFVSNEQPAVVIVGYLGPTRIGLINLKTHQNLGAKHASLDWNSVAIQPLDIKKSGEYEVYFDKPDNQHTSFKFSVTRNQTPLDEYQQTTNTTTEWPFGTFFRLELNSVKSFNNYDATFISLVEQKWYELIDSTNLPPKRGVVVLKFHLNLDGSISGIKADKSWDYPLYKQLALA